jgi:hypothetical protein
VLITFDIDDTIRLHGSSESPEPPEPPLRGVMVEIDLPANTRACLEPIFKSTTRRALRWKLPDLDSERLSSTREIRIGVKQFSKPSDRCRL